MIAQLTGQVAKLGDDFLILDVGGVGYLVQASGRTLSRLPAVGGDVSLMIETQVREDAITLFGFAAPEEQDMFRLLTSVQGVGARVGLAILGIMEPQALSLAIAAQDKAAVAQANGVGPKLAARIVNELKDKVAGLSMPATSGVSVSGSAASSATGASGGTVGAAGAVLADVVSALNNLGYRPSDAHGAAARVVADLGDDAELGALIPAALKELSR